MIQMNLEEDNTKSFDNAVALEMDKAIVHLEKELVSIRTGKAHTNLIEDVKVECYGSMMALRELASIAAPATNLLTIQPWDKGVISSIEKALITSHLGVTPQTDGDMIRIELPQMSSARREELTKVVGKKVEEAKVALRHIRKDFINTIRDNEKNKAISEDFSKRLSKHLQDSTDKFIAKTDVIGDKKKKDLTSF